MSKINKKQLEKKFYELQDINLDNDLDIGNYGNSTDERNFENSVLYPIQCSINNQFGILPEDDESVKGLKPFHYVKGRKNRGYHFKDYLMNTGKVGSCENIFPLSEHWMYEDLEYNVKNYIDSYLMDEKKHLKMLEEQIQVTKENLSNLKNVDLNELLNTILEGIEEHIKPLYKRKTSDDITRFDVKSYNNDDKYIMEVIGNCSGNYNPLIDFIREDVEEDIEDLENSIVKKGNKLDSLKNSLSELEKYESNGKLKIHSYNQPKYSTEKFSIYFDKSESK